MIIVTGGAGFIGSNFVHYWLKSYQEPVLVLDALTYAGNLKNLEAFQKDPRLIFVKGDIGDATLVSQLFQDYQARALLNFAAESHVDRSIYDPQAFLRTNIDGTYVLLQQSLLYFQKLPLEKQAAFRFLQVSTDEVYGSLLPDDPPFSETTPYAPNSPYAASKAASDHLVRAWHHTYGLPTLISNCSNNYGPLQFPEKLIPLMIQQALAFKPLPIYGDGQNIRDWLYVEDHCRALDCILQQGQAGAHYNVGGNNELKNIEVVQRLCELLDDLQPRADGRSYRQQMTFVADRPGHDRRYAINSQKLQRELGWQPQESFRSGLEKTVRWYLQHIDWVNDILSGAYQQWLALHYGEGKVAR
jgi:dTDP-glucose 4,6-dehydratase